MLTANTVFMLWWLLLIPALPALFVLLTAAFALLTGMGLLMWRFGNRRPSA